MHLSRNFDKFDKILIGLQPFLTFLSFSLATSAHFRLSGEKTLNSFGKILLNSLIMLKLFVNIILATFQHYNIVPQIFAAIELS